MKKAISILLVLALLAGLCVTAFAEENTISVFVSICKDGAYVIGSDGEPLATVSVAVSDHNKNGKFDIDDTLFCAHELLYKGGAEAGYASAQTDYGLSMTKLWGDESGAFSYYINNAMVVTDTTAEVKNGDLLTAYVYADQVGWTDTYTYFTAIAFGGHCIAGEDVELVLMKDVFGTPEPFAGAKILANGKQVCVTDELGHVRFQAGEPGTVILTAESDDLTIVPPYCKLTVMDAAARAFLDVDLSAWYAPDVAYAAAAGLLKGVSETAFCPNGTMSRAMLVTALYRLAGEPAFMNDNVFTDVPAGSWFEKAVVWANGKDIVRGISEDRFDPDVPVTREQLAVILFRYCKVTEANNALNWSDPDTRYLRFADLENVSDYAYDAMIWAVELDILTGSGDRLLPQQPATRAQVAAILHRFCEAICK